MQIHDQHSDRKNMLFKRTVVHTMNATIVPASVGNSFPLQLINISEKERERERETERALKRQNNLKKMSCSNLQTCLCFIARQVAFCLSIVSSNEPTGAYMRVSRLHAASTKRRKTSLCVSWYSRYIITSTRTSLLVCSCYPLSCYDPYRMHANVRYNSTHRCFFMTPFCNSPVQ